MSIRIDGDREALRLQGLVHTCEVSRTGSDDDWYVAMIDIRPGTSALLDLNDVKALHEWLGQVLEDWQ